MSDVKHSLSFTSPEKFVFLRVVGNQHAVLKGTVAVVCDYHKDVTLSLLVFQSKSAHYSSLQSSKVLENCQEGSTL